MTKSEKSLDLDKIDEDYEKLVFDIKYDKEQLKDPLAVGLAVYRLAEERKKTNYLFKEILKKLDAIAKSLGKEKTPPKTSEELLSEVDKNIIDYVQQSGKVDAEMIRGHFDYRGKNAASARLNSLFQRGLLTKARAGKKVLYWVQG